MDVKKTFRPMTNASRLWVAAADLWPPFCNQMIIEGTGTIDIALLKKAVYIASVENPGSRLILKGFPGNRRFIDSGSTPPVREVDGSAWSGSDMHGASFLFENLNLRNGPSCEVVLINGCPLRLAIRTHHAVMDGRGTMTWAEDIFRVMRNEKADGSEFLTLEDDLLNLTDEIEKPVAERYISPLGKPGTGNGFNWCRKTIKGKYKNLLPSIMLITASEAWKYQDGKVRIGIPVDLRTRRNDLRSTANLTNAIFFNIDKNMSADELAVEIKRRLAEQIDGILTWEDRIMKFIPDPLLKIFLDAEKRKSRGNGLYRYSAIISNLGKIRVESFSTDAFRAKSAFFIPPGNELTPFFMTLQGTDDNLEIVLTIPACYDQDKRIDEILNRIINGLQTGTLHTHE